MFEERIEVPNSFNDKCLDLTPGTVTLESSWPLLAPNKIRLFPISNLDHLISLT